MSSYLSFSFFLLYPPLSPLSLFRQHLECHMLQLIDYVEVLQQETYKVLGYERNSIKQQQMKQQFIQKRVCQPYQLENSFKLMIVLEYVKTWHLVIITVQLIILMEIISDDFMIKHIWYVTNWLNIPYCEMIDIKLMFF